MDDLSLAKEKLNEEGCTFAAARDGQVISSEKCGILPLLDLLDGKAMTGDMPDGGDAPVLNGWAVADKVVGKAPAMLYVLLGPASVYAHVMTIDAEKVLGNAGIRFCSDVETEKIINRRGTDICPMEKAVSGTDDPEEALEAVRNTEKMLAAQLQA